MGLASCVRLFRTVHTTNGDRSLYSMLGFTVVGQTVLDECLLYANICTNKYCKIYINTLNAELNPICHLLALIGAHHIFHVSMIRVKLLRHVSVLIHHLQGVYSCIS